MTITTPLLLLYPPPLGRSGEDPTLISKQQIFARIVGALGGRAAEEVIFGEAEVTSGASGDLQQVRQLMQCTYTVACLLLVVRSWFWWCFGVSRT
jgi:hypothetical protein